MRSRSCGSVRVFYPPFERDWLIEQLERKVQPLSVVLFGSWAMGRQTAASDIDLLVVYEGERRDDAYALVKRTVGIPRLEPHAYCEGDYEVMKGTLGRMIRGGIVIAQEPRLLARPGDRP